MERAIVIGFELLMMLMLGIAGAAAFAMFPWPFNGAAIVITVAAEAVVGMIVFDLATNPSLR